MRIRELTVILPGLLAAYQCFGATISALVRMPDGTGVGSAVVVAVRVDTGSVPARPAKSPAPEIIDQIDYEFVPRIKPVYVGSSVRFPNKDNVRHHVYSFSPAKHFELPLYAGTPAAAVVFDKPGVVVLGCNIHDWMIGYVYVSESPYFAMTGADGGARLSNLPPGKYMVRVWHPQSEVPEGNTARQIELDDSRAATLAWSVKLRPEIRVRRAPVPGGHSHY